MIEDLTDTTASEIRGRLAKARDQQGGPTTGVVLNLIIMTDESRQHDAVKAASEAARAHPSRVLGVITRDAGGESRLDAEIRTGDGAPGQTVLLRLHGLMSLHADSVVAPLLVSDTPVVAWWPGAVPPVPSAEPVGVLAQRRITDAVSSGLPAETLAGLAAAYRPGDTDFSWTRATPWRSLLAATLDAGVATCTGGVVAAEEHNPSADLLAAWLSARLGAPFRRDVSGGPGITSVTVLTEHGELVVSRPDGRNATLSLPGHPERHVALHRRDTAELLAEELRTLYPDEVYGETLAALAATQMAGR